MCTSIAQLRKRNLMYRVSPLFLGLLIVVFAPAVTAKSDGTFPGKGSYTAWVNANHFLTFGNQYAEKGELDKALDCYRKAVHTYPFDSAYYFNMANAFAMKGQYPIAEESYRKAIELESDYFQAWLNLGHTVARQGRPHEAAEALKHAAKLAQNPQEKEAIEKQVVQFEQLPQMESPQAPSKKEQQKQKKKQKKKKD